ncbi:MAG TPA: hypothetical protein VFC47_15435 [Caulobacteraceae bacterium]|nr:hypothetical protein [Caulobacteraceae bacterium]
MSLARSEIIPTDAPWAPAGPRRLLRLWLPVTPLAALLTPLALIALPFLAPTLLRRGVSPWRAISGLGAVLLALSGTLIEVENARATIRIHIV